MPASYPESPKTIGEHIKKKRIELNLFQRDVANILKVSECSITNWEKNRTSPKIQLYPDIIKFLGYFPMEVDTTTIGGQLKAYRYQNGLTQDQMAVIFNVDGSTICSWENEEVKFSSCRLKEIEKIIKL